MLDYEIGDDRAYFTIMDKLERLYFKTAYLCLFENEVVYRQNQNFKMPENILLKAFYRYCDTAVLNVRAVWTADQRDRRSIYALYNTDQLSDQFRC